MTDIVAHLRLFPRLAGVLAAAWGSISASLTGANVSGVSKPQ